MPEKRLNFRKKMRRAPLSTMHADVEPFYLLALSQKRVRFFACTADTIEPKKLDARSPVSLADSERFMETGKTAQPARAALTATGATAKTRRRGSENSSRT